MDNSIVWPDLTHTQFYTLSILPAGITLFSILVFYLIRKKWIHPEISFASKGDIVLQPGDTAGSYKALWFKTFDMDFLIGWSAVFIILFITTYRYEFFIFEEMTFWIFLSAKLMAMIIVAILAGLVCRHFCETDENLRGRP
jgi:hypothetical protein